MRMRHAVIADAGPGWVEVDLDGVTLTVTVPDDLTLTVLDRAVILQDGRRMVAVGGIPPA